MRFDVSDRASHVLLTDILVDRDGWSLRKAAGWSAGSACEHDSGTDAKFEHKPPDNSLTPLQAIDTGTSLIYLPKDIAERFYALVCAFSCGSNISVVIRRVADTGIGSRDGSLWTR